MGCRTPCDFAHFTSQGFGQMLPPRSRESFLKGQVADYKLPEMIEQFDDLPMTGTGKIRRHILRDLVTARMGRA